MLPLRPHDQQGHKAVHEHGTIWSIPVTYKSSPVGEPTGPRAATNMFLEFNLGSRSVALLVYPHAPKTHN